MSVRRRGLIGAQQHEVIPPLEYPDAYLVVFYGDAGVAKQIPHYPRINRYVLDGVEVTPVEWVHKVTPTTSGYHFLYFWLGGTTRLTGNVNPTYLRIPENPTNWNPDFIMFNTIDRIDCMSSTPYTLNSDSTKYSVVNNLYVPHGSKELYSVANGWKKFKNVIAETNNFNYTI